MNKKYVSIDIGGTAIKHGIIDENGEIFLSGHRETEAGKGGSAILRKAIEIVDEYRKIVKIDGICISTAGMVDIEKGEIIHAAPLISNYKGTRFKKSMEEIFEVPCEVENDVNCAALAEYVSGAAKGSKVVLMLTIGTGIGGCMIIDGCVYHGFSQGACEVGYMYMDGSDFQTLGSASALSKNVAVLKNEPEDIWNGYRIFQEAQKGDIICIRAIDEMVDILGKGISSLCYVVNPEIVVLGGGIMEQKAYLKDRIEKSVNHWLLPIFASQTRIAFAKHQNYAGMLGAFCHFKQRQSKIVINQGL